MSKAIDAFFTWLGDVTANAIILGFRLARRATLLGLAGCMCGVFAGSAVLTFNLITKGAQ